MSSSALHVVAFGVALALLAESFMDIRLAQAPAMAGQVIQTAVNR